MGVDVDHVLGVGVQRVAVAFVAFGDDVPGVCWRCRFTPTSEPLETCRKCREELSDG
jgi:hypothetical protein